MISLLKKPSLDSTNPGNFRPISQLPFVAKATEFYVNSILSEYVESNQLLDPSQNGFRRRHSTESALLAVTEDIRRHLDAGNSVALILLDLGAAFDTVSHDILLGRLQGMGVRGLALEWFWSFLTDRSFQVMVPPFQSQVHSIRCGVPQGSILSPVLFNIYV